MSDSSGTLAEVVARARERWPGLSVSAADISRELSDRWDGDVAELAGRPYAVDIVLVAACLHGDEGALRVFDDLLRAAVRSIAPRMGFDDSASSEAAQRLRDRLVAGSPERPPKLSAYGGTGALPSWLRVCATREALMMKRGEARAVPVDDELERAIEPMLDPELRVLKDDGRVVLKRALQRAVSELAAEQKVLLAHHLLDGLTHREVGRLLGVDASTVSRRLRATQHKLLSDARTIVTSQLKMEAGDFVELLTMVRSQLDLSLNRILRDDPDPPSSA